MNPRELFRKEAIRHSARRLDGEVMLGLPLSWKLLVLVLAAVVVLGLALVSVLSYSRKETVTGWLVPRAGMIRVAARDSGVLVQLSVSEGQRVRAGEVLATVRVSMDSVNGDAGQLQQQAVQAQLDASETGARAKVEQIEAGHAQLQTQRQALEARLAQARRFVDILASKQALAQTNLQRARELSGRGFLTRRDLDDAEAAHLAAQEDVAQARGDALAIEQQLAEATSQIAAVPIQLAQARSQSAAEHSALRGQLEQVTAVRSYSLTAPMAAKVMTLPLDLGQAVNGGGTVAILTPDDSPLEAELFVPSRAAGFIRDGQDVTLQYQAFPYQKFGSAKGRVLSVSGTALAPADVALPGTTLHEPVFRVRARLERDFMTVYGERAPLQPGMLLQANIIIERRSLIEWLLDPLYAVGRRS